FTGNDYIDIHFGNFCLQQRVDGVWTLANENTPISECVFSGDLNSEFRVSDYLSLAYMNFEQNVGNISRNTIDVHLDTSGISAPRRDYPSSEGPITAKLWNKIARENN